MSSEKMFFEAAKQMIFEWMDVSKYDQDFNYRVNGWDAESMIDEVDATSLGLVERLKSLTNVLDEDEVDLLVYCAEEAYRNIENWIIETYGTDLAEAVGA